MEKRLGTAWTEPGQGATGNELAEAIHASHDSEDKIISWEKCDSFYTRLLPLKWRQTNLRLTGAPLTAEDLKRISECK